MRPNTLAPVCAGETRASMRPATRLSHARGPSSTRPIQPGGCEQCHVNPRCIVSIGAPCRTYAPAARDTNCTGRIPRQFVSSVSCPSSIIQSCRPPVSHGLTSVVLGNARTHSTHEQKGAISLSEPGRPAAAPGRPGPLLARDRYGHGRGPDHHKWSPYWSHRDGGYSLAP